jgi:hypothetical protein
VCVWSMAEAAAAAASEYLETCQAGQPKHTARARERPHLAVVAIVVEVRVAERWVVGVAPALNAHSCCCFCCRVCCLVWLLVAKDWCCCYVCVLRQPQAAFARRAVHPGGAGQKLQGTPQHSTRRTGRQEDGGCR